MRRLPNLKRMNGLFAFDAVTLFEHVNTSAGIYELLLTREERMALGANFDTDILFRRSGRNDVPTSAGNIGLFILRMNILFHCCHLFQLTLQI